MTHHRVRYPCQECGAPMPVTYVLPVCNACLDDWAEREELTEEGFYVFRLPRKQGAIVFDGPCGDLHVAGPFESLTRAFRAAKHAAGWDA